MPELPEVENVRLGLEALLPGGSRSKALHLLRPDLRFPFPESLAERVCGQVLTRIFRRAKYLVFEFENVQIVSHLGMTGSWRAFDEAIAHDHLIWEFENGPTLVFNDPRRFGFLTLFEIGTIPSHFESLGPEPLEKDFNAEYLFEKSCCRRVQPMKTFLLDQKNVAGLGNIYVCEALFSWRRFCQLVKRGQLKRSKSVRRSSLRLEKSSTDGNSGRADRRSGIIEAWAGSGAGSKIDSRFMAEWASRAKFVALKSKLADRPAAARTGVPSVKNNLARFFKSSHARLA